MVIILFDNYWLLLPVSLFIIFMYTTQTLTHVVVKQCKVISDSRQIK